MKYFDVMSFWYMAFVIGSAIVWVHNGMREGIIFMAAIFAFLLIFAITIVDNKKERDKK